MKLCKKMRDNKESVSCTLYSDEHMVAESQVSERSPGFDLTMGPSSAGLQSEPLPSYPPPLADVTHVRAVANIALVGVGAGGGAFRGGVGPASVPIGIGAAASVVPSNCTGSSCHFDE